MSKYCLLISIFLFSVSCVDQNRSEDAIVGSVIDSGNKELQQGEVTRLAGRKSLTDTLISQKKLRLEVLVQQPNSDKLVVVLDEDFPEEVERTFHIWRDAGGMVVLIGEYPYSESGDWYIEYKHYFNEAGEVFAFERVTNFFNSICTDEVAHEVMTDFYDPAFRKLHQVYALTDMEGNKLKKEACEFHYDYPYGVSRSVDTYLREINYPVN